MGAIDKVVRLVLVAVIAVLYFNHIISGLVAIILGYSPLCSCSQVW